MFGNDIPLRPFFVVFIARAYLRRQNYILGERRKCGGAAARDENLSAFVGARYLGLLLWLDFRRKIKVTRGTARGRIRFKVARGAGAKREEEGQGEGEGGGDSRGRSDLGESGGKGFRRSSPQLIHPTPPYYN